MQCTRDSNYRKDGSFITAMPPCGHCLACRMNDRRIWASRLVCERKSHEYAQFITLTYADESLPTSEKQSVKTFQDFIKRYRKNIGHQPRYFACMEYGSRFGRVHWHAIFFGETTEYVRRRHKGIPYTVDPHIEDNWQNGSTYTKDCNYSTQGQNITQYIAGYILKDKWKPNGFSSKHTKSELGLQSRKPYIGQPVTNLIAELITTKQGASRCLALGTVPDRIKFANRYYRLYPRIRKDVAKLTGYPYLPVPWNDGTIIDINGSKIIKEIPRRPDKLATAKAAEKRISKSIRRLRSINTTTETG